MVGMNIPRRTGTQAPSSLAGFRFLSVGITVGITALTTSSVLTVSKKMGSDNYRE